MPSRDADRPQRARWLVLTPFAAIQDPMRLSRLTWLCGALFILFGLPMVFAEDQGWQKAWASLSTLSLGCFGLAMVADGLVKGEIRLQFSLIRRATQPRTFWATIVLVAAAGVGTIITAIWATFFKIW